MREDLQPIYFLNSLERKLCNIAFPLSSVLRPLNIECSGFDPIFRFCTLLQHIYVRIRTYYLPCVLSAAGWIRSSSGSALSSTHLCTYTYVLLTVRPILRFFGVTVDKSAYNYAASRSECPRKNINGLRIHVSLNVLCVLFVEISGSSN